MRTADGDVPQGLYDPGFEHDSCGIGAVVNIKGDKSHETVADALTIVENLEHRAGKDAKGKTGDGVGILMQISHRFFSRTCEALGIFIGQERDYGIGMFFFPQDELERNQSRKMFEIIAAKEGLEFLGWRSVPVNPDVLGERALEKMPFIMQCFLKRPQDCAPGIDFDRRLYIVRRIFEKSSENTYVVSLSGRTIVYKGMFLVKQLRSFYDDLQSPDYMSAIAVVHSRFSTNTDPSWKRAHPNRYTVHNGEINTIRGNVDKMRAREETMESDALSGQMYKVLPAVDADGSDSSMFDNMLEFLVMSGMELPLAVMTAIPEPWSNNRAMSRSKKDFYQYYATMMEPWDGPASIVFSDGEVMGAVLDRNGLRPSRYYITKDGRLILSSEVGVLPVKPECIVKKDRLHPGKMLLVDTAAGCIIDDETLKERYASRRPYGEWLDGNLVNLKDLRIPNEKVPRYSKEELARLQKVFGYTFEECDVSILSMAGEGKEMIGSMGADIPLAVLSDIHQPLFNYFKQIFAQVTNPPIDAIREKVITSTTVYAGRAGNLLCDKEENCRVLRINNPILTNTDLQKIRHMNMEGFKVEVISILYYKNTNLEKAIDNLFVEADRAYREGADIIILSDRGVDEYNVPIPSLLAVSALQQYLVRTKKRTQLALILESGEPRNVHDFAALLGYGACAVNPYLAHETIRSLVDSGMLDKDFYAACDDYNQAVLDGIVKIASKMGISTLRSYQGAKIFEAVGLDKTFIDRYFTDTVSRIGGIGIEDIAEDYNRIHSAAFDPLGLGVDLELESTGKYKERSGGEKHLYDPAVIHLLQTSVRTGNYSIFKEYTKHVNAEEAEVTLRGLLDFNYPRRAVPISEVESVDEIVKRFKTGAMSYGSISKEAHETLAAAMNSISGRSNTGEGGEDESRLDVQEDGVNRCSAIKQVASGRFGVTSRYLVSAKEIQIKMAQGAKPGEGGHLPGKKVYPWIASTRHSTPGVSLISPPPHHDIYSIEDLAQLIYDCKNANRDARISVKLVSEAGVGTVAAGVAKAGAQVILISGCDGGTGAAPVSSIYNAGLPWEMGLAETHQTLIRNGLRQAVRLETDGKLMTGRDVAVAAILGAEEFGFATAPLIAMGCVMMRACSLDTCPVGIATQNPKLRARFGGRPEYVVNFMRFIAEDLREYMARLGVRSIDELVGRTDLLRVKENPEANHASKIKLESILFNPYAKSRTKQRFDSKHAYPFRLEKSLDAAVLMKKLLPYLEKGKPAQISLEVKNTDRAFGTIFGSEITRRYPNGLPEDTYRVCAGGAGGQSFGAFIPQGLTLELAGDSNDYFGKGLSGGKLIVYPPKGVTFKKDENIIIGNVALYGATGGKAFICGTAGERFCVRNSGAEAVVEGVGDHGCEYMTGGCVVVIGRTGKNFAAGMSGGTAYVLDTESDLYMRVNKELVSIEHVREKKDIEKIRSLLEEHTAAVRSEKGREILDHFEDYITKFKKIIPYEYEKITNEIERLEENGMSKEEAEMEAFSESAKGGTVNG